MWYVSSETGWTECNLINSLRPRQNGRHFADDIFKSIFLNENIRMSINISLKYVPKGRINYIPALVQIMAWRRPGDKPLSEPMMVSLLTHICITRPRCINHWGCTSSLYIVNWDTYHILIIILFYGSSIITIYLRTIQSDFHINPTTIVSLLTK